MTDQDEKLNQAFADEIAKYKTMLWPQDNPLGMMERERFHFFKAGANWQREQPDGLEDPRKKLYLARQEIDRLKSEVSILNTHFNASTESLIWANTERQSLEQQLAQEKQRAKGLASAARKFLKSNSGDWAENILEIEQALNNYSDGGSGAD